MSLIINLLFRGDRPLRVRIVSRNGSKLEVKRANEAAEIETTNSEETLGVLRFIPKLESSKKDKPN